jgi:RNA polymerase sigma-70 factor (ECF subfamily)
VNPQPAPAAAIWADFAAPLRAFVRKRAPDGVDVDDVVQEIFARVHEHLPALRDHERIDGWIFQIARHILADAFRHRRRDHALQDQIIATDDDASDHGALGAVAELTACLAPMIARLAEPYRQAIELTELHGLTQVEAARRAGLSLSGMKSRVQRGREQLKRIITTSCAIELDVRGGVTGCEPRPGGCGERLRPPASSRDSMGMTNPNNQNESQPAGSLTTTAPKEAAATGCCGGPAPAGASACCALDAEVKATGGSGCGCAAKTSAQTPAQSTARKGCC